MNFQGIFKEGISPHLAASLPDKKTARRIDSLISSLRILEALFLHTFCTQLSKAETLNTAYLNFLFEDFCK